MNIGIESLSFFTSRYVLDLRTMAKARGVDAEKVVNGIGQEKMSVPPPGEDVITLAANAGHQALASIDTDSIEMVMFATESATDQSKAGGIYVHNLLKLKPYCRVIELKQACYSGTAGLLLARDMIQQHPERKVLILMSDIARYGLNSAGEITQGAGAIAMVVSSQPKIMTIEPDSGYYTQDVMDFWRPNYRDEALVDGKYSVRIYLKALTESWNLYHQRTRIGFEQFARFCYHLPFSRMAEKAHKHLAKINHIDLSENELATHINDGLIYNREIGNIYTGSLYLSLISMLENNPQDMSNQKVSLFSYGSGCVGELFAGQVLPGYRNYLNSDLHQSLLESRKELSYPEYSDFYNFAYAEDGTTQTMPSFDTGCYRLSQIKDHKRIYEML